MRKRKNTMRKYQNTMRKLQHSKLQKEQNTWYKKLGTGNLKNISNEHHKRTKHERKQLGQKSVGWQFGRQRKNLKESLYCVCVLKLSSSRSHRKKNPGSWRETALRSWMWKKNHGVSICKELGWWSRLAKIRHLFLITVSFVSLFRKKIKLFTEFTRSDVTLFYCIYRIYCILLYLLY